MTTPTNTPPKQDPPSHAKPTAPTEAKAPTAPLNITDVLRVRWLAGIRDRHDKAIAKGQESIQLSCTDVGLLLALIDEVQP